MTSTPLRYLTPFALVLGLAACGQKASVDTNTTVSEVTDAASTPGEAAAGTPGAQQFADKAAKSDAFEVAAARLAATNAALPQVKAFAKQMIAAHTDSTIKIKNAADAAAPAIKPDATLTDDQTTKLADLGKLKGAEFDKAYAAGQVAAHDEALALMKAYAASGDAPTLKTAAGEIVPVVTEHLVMARALATAGK
jgi:putative membrane protein